MKTEIENLTKLKEQLTKEIQSLSQKNENKLDLKFIMQEIYNVCPVLSH